VRAETIEKLFDDFRDEAFMMGIIDPSDAVMVCNDSTCYQNLFCPKDNITKAWRNTGRDSTWGQNPS